MSNPRRFNPLKALFAALALAGLIAPALLASGAAAARAALPNPCTILAAAHAEKSIGKGASTHVAPGQLKKYGTGVYLSETCSETVGALKVYLSVSGPESGGFGGVRVTSTTHPAGFGGTATLIVGTGAGNGAPVDFILFHRGLVHADVSANGASPSGLTALAQAIYALLP